MPFKSSISPLASQSPSLVIVEDDQQLASAYETWVPDDWAVETVHTGEDALEAIDGSIDVVLLDRDLPDINGSDVLSRLRDRGYSGWVAMVTGADPDYDIIDMQFDEYLQKPIDEQALKTTVEELYARSAYNDQVRELFSLQSKIAELQVEKSPGELESHEGYQSLVEQADELERQLDDCISQFDSFEGVIRDLGRVDD